MRLVDGRRLGQIAAGDDRPGALRQVGRERSIEAGQVVVDDPPRFQVEDVFEVVEDQGEPQLFHSLDGEPEPLFQSSFPSVIWP